jgi:hypothetical protein
MSTHRRHHHSKRIATEKQYLTTPLSTQEVVHRRYPGRQVWSEENLERVCQGKLDGQDPRCQAIMLHLCGTFDEGSVYRLMRKQFPGCRDRKNMHKIANRIMRMHCECWGYTDGTIAGLLEECLWWNECVSVRQ